MAFTKDYTFRGLLVTNAYHRVGSIQVFKKYPNPQDPEMIQDPFTGFNIPETQVKFCMFISLEISSAQGNMPIDTKNHYTASYTPFPADVMSTAYIYLLTLPEYAGAVSV